MAAFCFLLPQFQLKGCPHSSSLVQVSAPSSSNICADLKFITRRSEPQFLRCSICRAYCSLGVPPNINISPFNALKSGTHFCQQTKITDILSSNNGKMQHGTTNFKQSLMVLDLNPAAAKVAIGILGPFLSAFSFLFILRIVMSWYPKLQVEKFPYVIAYAPTEPLLIPTRKLIPPLGGVDVTPVVWFGLVSFLNEILVGPQGLLVLLSQQVS